MEQTNQELPTFEASLDGTHIDINGIVVKITDPAILLDGQGQVLSLNASARELFSLCDICMGVGSQFDQDFSIAKEIILPTTNSGTRSIETQPIWAQFNNQLLCLLVMQDSSEKRWCALESKVMTEITACLQEVNHRRQMMVSVIDKLLALVNLKSCFFASYFEETGESLIEYARGWNNQIVGLSFSGESCVLSSVMRSGKIYLNNQLQNQEAQGCSAMMENHTSFLIAPMKAGKKVIGALGVMNDHPILEQQVNILKRAAWLIGTAYHRAKLQEEIENNLNRMAALRMISLAVSVSLDLNITLNLLLDQVTSQLNADAGDILLLNMEKGELELIAGCGFWHPELLNRRICLEQGLVGKMINQQRILRLPDSSLDLGDFERKDLLNKEKFISYYAVPLIIKGTAKGVLELYSRRAIRADSGWMRFLEALAAEAAVAIDNTELFRQLQHSHDDLSLAYDATIQGWSKTLELRDLETKGHSERVVELTQALARKLNLPEDQMIHLRRGALLHDIGKTGIPDSILLKPGPLSDEEITIMQKHPEYAMRLLSSVPFLRPALDIPYCHHEKWAGGGYPRGLKGEEIPLAARIFSVVDVYDALRYERPYRYAWSKKRIFNYIRSRSGEDFDPQVVRAFLEIVNCDDGD